MVFSNLTADQMHALMRHPTNIRNVSVIGHVGHGKSALTDFLVSQAGIKITAESNSSHPVDGEQPRGIATNSTCNLLFFEIDPEDLVSIKQESVGKKYLINLIDPLGHGDLASETTLALRVTDGSLVVVDCVDGVCLQTENALRQAIAERIKPTLIINKVDCALFELQLNREALYQSFKSTIDSVNAIISAYYDPVLGDVQVYPDHGTVAFGSALHGWGFTLRRFAKRYGRQFGIDTEKIMMKLWGENYFDPATRQWTTSSTDSNGNALNRAFNKFVLDPIYQIFDAVITLDHSLIPILLEKLGIELEQHELDMEGMPLFHAIMRKFLPVGDSLLETIVINLPSPATAQKYRVEALYEGPMDDESAIGIRHCDPDAPLVLYVTRMVPTSQKGRFYAFGRVFSGTVHAGTSVRIQGPKYIQGQKDDLFLKVIQRAVVMNGSSVEPIEDCPAGNIVGMVGIDHFPIKSGTVSTSETAHNMRVMKLSVSPIVQVAVEVETATDLPKLVEELRQLSKVDPCIQTWVSELGDVIVASPGELHLNIFLKNLKDDLGVPLKISEPIISYRETVTTESSTVALSKSQNKHNRIYAKAMPLDEELTKVIEVGNIGPRDDHKLRGRILADTYRWDLSEAKKIWCFGPDASGPNILVDATKSVRYMNELKDYCVSAFQWATKEGVLCEENMRGVRVNIIDVTLQGDAIHRGGGQIIPTTRRAIYASYLLAKPTLQEPILLVETQCPESTMEGVYKCIQSRRGLVFTDVQRAHGTHSYIVKGYVPASESFGLSDDLQAHTSGHAFSTNVFDHWESMDGSPLEKGSAMEKLVTKIRTRKGLRPEIPLLSTYNDKL